MIAPGTETIGEQRGRMDRTVRRICASLVLLAAALGATACDKVPLTAPTGSTVTLFSNTTIVPVNGTAEITATVIEAAGTGVQNGTLVTFSTTIGTIDPAEARTSAGKATVRLVAGGRSGRATVRAFSGGTTSGDLMIDIGGAAAGRITLGANPTTVSASGGTSTLIAVVFDVDGNRLPGVPVSFTTTAGSIAASVVVSDASGEARTTITTNRDATVTATAGGRGGDGGAAITAETTITAVALPTVSVSVQTATPTVGQNTVFSVTAAATAPNSIRNVTIDFGDGQSQSLGVVSSTTVSHQYSSAGTFIVTVTAEDTSGARVSQSTSVVVSPAVPALVSLTASPSTLNTGEIVTFTVSVSSQGGPSATVRSVTFDFGDGNGSEANASLTRTHIYGRSGNFLATATVRFTDGTMGRAETAVRVR